MSWFTTKCQGCGAEVAVRERGAKALCVVCHPEDLPFTTTEEAHMREISGIRPDVPPGTLATIKKAIEDFDFSDFGWDDIEVSKGRPPSDEWLDRLAELIDKRLDTLKIIIKIREASK